MDISKLTQKQLEERWKWLLDEDNFTEIEVDYEIEKPIEIFYEIETKERKVRYFTNERS